MVAVVKLNMKSGTHQLKGDGARKIAAFWVKTERQFGWNGSRRVTSPGPAASTPRYSSHAVTCIIKLSWVFNQMPTEPEGAIIFSL